MNKPFCLLLFCGLVSLAGCSKKTVSTTNQPVKSVLNIEEIDFEYFHGKARMILRDAKKEQEVKANIRIRKDSVIWINFQVLGIQGGRALINKDSITILSSLKNEYFVFDYKELSKRFNLDINYNIIQAAMLGNPIIERKETDEVSQEHTMYLLKQQSGNVHVVNFINGASQKIEKVEMKEGNSSNSILINYSNFQPVGNKIFPYNGTINLFYKAVSGLLNTTIIFDYNKAEVGDRELKFPFNIPKRYDRR